MSTRRLVNVRDQDRIVGCVIDPAVPKHSMLSCSDQRTVSTSERLCPVGHRHLISGGPFPRSVGYQPEPDSDLSLRIVEPEPAGLGQLRHPACSEVPRLIGQPERQEIQLVWAQRGAVNDRHASPVPLGRMRRAVPLSAKPRSGIWTRIACSAPIGGKILPVPSLVAGPGARNVRAWVPRRWQRFTALSGPGGRWIVSHMGAFYIIRIMEREAAESAAARRPRVPSRRPDDHAALDAIRSNPSLVRRVIAAMRRSADGGPGGAGRGRRRLGRAARAH
jgi:hypothetical protein